MNLVETLGSAFGYGMTMPVWLYATAGLVLVVAGVAVGRAGVRAERKLRREAEVQARAGAFAIGRVEVQTAKEAALTAAVGGRPPPRVGIVLPDRSQAAQAAAALEQAVAEQRAHSDALVATVVSRTDELIEASSLGTEVAAELRSGVTPAGELTGVIEEQADWDEGGEPPTDPYDVEPTPSDAEEGLPRDETRVLAYGDRGDGPPGGESPMQAQGYRFAWAHLRGEELPEPGPWRPPMAWMVQAPIRMQRRYSRLRVWLTGTAGKLADAASWKPGDLATLTGVDMVLPSERLLQGPGIHRKPRWWQRKPAATEGKHRPEVVARTTRAVRTLRDDWRAVLTAPRRTPIVPFPGRCIP